MEIEEYATKEMEEHLFEGHNVTSIDAVHRSQFTERTKPNQNLVTLAITGPGDLGFHLLEMSSTSSTIDLTAEDTVDGNAFAKLQSKNILRSQRELIRSFRVNLINAVSDDVQNENRGNG